MTTSQGRAGTRRLLAGRARGPVQRGVVGLVVLALCIVGGCKQSPKTTTPKRLTPRGASYLEGVPVPAGFKLVDDMVMDHESGGQRLAQHEYEGSGDPHEIRDFYRTQMPSLGWDCVSDQNFKGVMTIRFENRKEACTVEIRSGGLLGRDITIKVLVVPFSRTPLGVPSRSVP